MEIQDIIIGLTSAEIAAITSPDERTLIVNETLNQAVIYVNGTFKQASFTDTDDIPEGVTNKYITTSDLSQITTNANDITALQTGKEDSFTKNTAFNKDFGIVAGTVLEGNTVTISAAETAKLAFITVSQGVDLDTLESDVTLNNAKITNANHTGEVSGAGALTVNATAISNKASVTPAAGMEVLLNDSGILKKGNVSAFIGGGGDMLKATYDPTNVAADVYDYANALGITQVTGAIVRVNVTSDEDNYNPAGFGTTNLLELNPTGADRDITGFVAPAVGVVRIITVVNISDDKKIKFKNNDSSSSAANRLLLKDDGDKDLKKQNGCRFYYDHTDSRWRVFGAGT